SGQGKGGALFIASGATAIALGAAPTFTGNSASDAGSNSTDNANLHGSLTVDSAATLTATAGTPQSTLVNSPFAQPLQVTLRDGSGKLLPGVIITFSSPDGGTAFPNGAFALTDGNGQASEGSAAVGAA